MTKISIWKTFIRRGSINADYPSAWFWRVLRRFLFGWNRFHYRRVYRVLPEFYKQFYPVDYACDLLIQNIEHREYEADKFRSLAFRQLSTVSGLEEENRHLRLALSCSEIWNKEDTCDFLAKFFPVEQER